MNINWKPKDPYSYVIIGIAFGGIMGDTLDILQERFAYSSGFQRGLSSFIMLLIALGWNLLGSARSLVAKSVRSALLFYLAGVAALFVICLPLALSGVIIIPLGTIRQVSIVANLGIPVLILMVAVWNWGTRGTR